MATIQKVKPMQPLYDKLAKLGFKKADIKKCLPDWWNDKLAETKAGYQQAALILSKRFGIDYASFFTDELKISLPIHRFKHQKNVTEIKLLPSTAVAVFSGKLVFQAFEKNLSDLSNLSAQTIRQTLLNRNNPWIDFESLVDYCWELGIPVIFAPNLPSPKMHGLALSLNGRPFIVITRKYKYGRLLFDLAHELGHVILGHVNDDNWIIDEKIDTNPIMEQEKQANNFAVELLTGFADTQFSSDKFLYPKLLAEKAITYGRQYQIDPMYIVLNYCYHNDLMSCSENALKIIVNNLGIQETDTEICVSALLKYIDIDILDDDEPVLKHIIGKDK